MKFSRMHLKGLVKKEFFTNMARPEQPCDRLCFAGVFIVVIWLWCLTGCQACTYRLGH